MIETKYKTFWPRFWTGWIDSLVFMPIAVINHFIWKSYDQLPIVVVTLWYLVHSLSGYAYIILMHGKYGQTLGKMATHVKVLDLSENRLTFSQAIKRDIIPLAFTVILIALNILKITSGINIYGHKPEAVGLSLYLNHSLTM